MLFGDGEIAAQVLQVVGLFDQRCSIVISHYARIGFPLVVLHNLRDQNANDLDRNIHQRKGPGYRLPSVLA